MSKLGFLGKAGTYVIGNSIQKAAVFFLVPIYTRYLSVEEFGLLGTLLSLVLILTLTIELGMASSLIRFYHEYSDNLIRLTSYLTISIILRITTSVLLAIILFLIGEHIWLLVTKNEVAYNPNFYLIIGIIFSDVIIHMVTSLFQAKQEAKRYIISKLSQTAIQIILILYFIFSLKMGITGVLLGQMLGSVIIAMILFSFYCLSEVSFNNKLDWSDIKHNLNYGLPLVPHSITIWVRNASDRIVLIQFVTLTSVGIYHLGFTIGLAIGVIVNSIDLAFTPTFYSILKNNKDKSESIVSYYSNMYVTILGLICISSILFTKEALLVFGGVEYLEAGSITPLIIFSFFLHGLYTINIKPILFFKKTKVIPLLTLIPAVLGIGLNILFVPKFGIQYAAWNTVIVFGLTFILVSQYSKKLFKIRYNINSKMVFIVLLSLSIIFYHFQSFDVNYISFLIKLTLLILATIIIYVYTIKNNFKYIIKYMK